MKNKTLWPWNRKRATSEGEEIRFENPTNPYFDHVSNVYHSLFLISLAALLVFSAVAMLTHIDLLTYENLYYLAKDIGTASNLFAGTEGVINYETAERNRTFALYRGGLAVAGDSGLQLFTATGRETLNASPEYAAPVMKSSDSFLLVYDVGEKSYSLYNSFVCVRHEEFDYPVLGGAVSDSGAYVVVTQTYEHAGAVRVYTKNYELSTAYLRNQMVIDADISDTGKRVAFVTTASENGAYTSTLVIAVPGEQETMSEMPFEGAFPYSVRFIDERRLFLLCDNAAYVVSVDDGIVLRTVNFGNMKLSWADANEQHTALLFTVNAVTDTHRLIVTDKNGNLVIDSEFTSKVSRIAVYENDLYMLTENGVVRIHPETGEYVLVECNTDGKDLLVCAEDEVLVCGGQSAAYYSIKFD